MVRDSSGFLRVEKMEDVDVYAFQCLMKWKEMLARVDRQNFYRVYSGQELHLFTLVNRWWYRVDSAILAKRLPFLPNTGVATVM